MKMITARIALAAALAMLSLPTLADDAPTCSVCGDPTWPTLENPAPPVVLHADGSDAASPRRADPTWPELSVALPAMRLVPGPADAPRLDPADPMAPEVSYALLLGAEAPLVATR
jgi:hypothetical protein